MTKTKIEKLVAIKEEVARVQARLAEVKKLDESATPGHFSKLLENDLEQAELVLAAQDIMNKLQNMAEDLAKMNAQDLFPLVDKMKGVFGQAASHAFESTSQEVLNQAMNSVRNAKDELGNSILRLEGKAPANDMAATTPATDPGIDMSADPEAGGDEGSILDNLGDDSDDGDDFGGAEGASGPEAEPLGRARRESVESSKSALSESVLLETAGRRLLETESLESLIVWALNEAALGMPEDHFKSFATQVATKAVTDPVKLAGWIGKKKHGAAAMAQLAQPTYTQGGDVDVVDNVNEGKTFRKGEDDEDADKADRFKSRKNARKDKEQQVDEGKTFRKGEDEDEDKADRFKSRKNARKDKADQVDEGKTFRHDDDEDDKADRFKSRKAARKDKESQVDESVIAAHAIASLIEASIAREGKGNAAKAVKEAVAYFVGKNLVESEEDAQATVLEAFQNAFGMKPAAFSVTKLREFNLSTSDENTAKDVMGKVASNIAKNPSSSSQPVSSALNGMDSSERNVAQKMINGMKQDGKDPKTVADFAAGQDGDDDNQNGSSSTTGTTGTTGTNEGLDENINAANWPTDTMGQYKGEPFQTDYQKLKGKSGTPAKTEGGAKAPEPKSETPSETKPAPKKEGGNPFAKKEETTEEPTEEKVEEGIKDKLKKAALGVGAAAALASGSASAKDINPVARQHGQVSVNPKANQQGQVKVDLKPTKKISINPKGFQNPKKHVDL